MTRKELIRRSARATHAKQMAQEEVVSVPIGRYLKGSACMSRSSTRREGIIPEVVGLRRGGGAYDKYS